MEKIFRRLVSNTQSKYRIEFIAKNITQQSSYNLDASLERYLSNNNWLKQIENDVSTPHRNYILVEGVKIILGANILALIGDKYSNLDNKVVFTHTSSNDGVTQKFQLKRNEFKKRNDPTYDWFVELYDRNIENINFLTKVDLDNKIITFDLEFSHQLFSNAIASEINKIQFGLNVSYPFSNNRIIFGAPGTGKSFILKTEAEEMKKEYGGDFERVTFHPDYSYANFVGTYKPIMVEDEISYSYVPGPFMRVLVSALKSGKSGANQPYLLVIEEINRANVAAVFGDVFQLLDRNSDGVSEYEIATSDEMRQYLAKELDVSEEEVATIRIPNNMFIWATMNSADQGVFPMDTAFKRRWDFTYLGIDDSENQIKNPTEFEVGSGVNARKVTWNDLRKAINAELSSSEYNLNEDKLMGPFFISQKVISSTSEEFISVFKNKVLMYLYDDAVKSKRITFFAKDHENPKAVRYSEVCKAFDEDGIFIFPKSVSDKLEEK